MLRRRMGAVVVAIVITSGLSTVGLASPAGAAHVPTIFEVETRHCANLHVGYNYFPAGTVVHWNVRQSSKILGNSWFASSGQFTTLGGGKTYHFLTQPLDGGLWPNPDAHVHFYWRINNVRFSYMAVRKPGCAGLRFSSPSTIRVGVAAHFASIDSCPAGVVKAGVVFIYRGNAYFSDPVAVGAGGAWSQDVVLTGSYPSTALAVALCRNPGGVGEGIAQYYSHPITILP